MQIGTDLPKRASRYEPREVEQAIVSAHIAFEILETRFKDKKAVSSLALLADSLGNGGLVVGDALPGWPDLDLAKVAVTLHVDGMATGAAMNGPSTEQSASPEIQANWSGLERSACPAGV